MPGIMLITKHVCFIWLMICKRSYVLSSNRRAFFRENTPHNNTETCVQCVQLQWGNFQRSKYDCCNASLTGREVIVASIERSV